MTTDIKERKQLTHVNLKDGRVLVSEATPQDIYDWIGNNTHIMIEGELHSKFDIINAVPSNIDEIEEFLMTKDKEERQELRNILKQRKLEGKRINLVILQDISLKLKN